MYKVMIIDDETAVRRLLRASIDWESLDLEVAGEASSGIEAINTIDDINPDIVFVDICMPFMNGIEFTKAATARYPELMVIVLTGFDDFEYARQCVSLPVVEYMLKPIVRKDVQEVLKKVVEKLKQRKTEALCEEQETQTFASTGMEQIAQFLRDNYKNATINLTSVAQQFGFNACYLSRRFKQEMGVTFVEYLMKCRMECAMELVKSGRKMFETANEVGIPDPNYFGRCFKKYTGVSYSEYAEGMK
ncbi:MAG: response regulator [Acetatifactor sp.]